MKKYILASVFLLFTISAFAQKKKKQKRTTPIKIEVPPPAIQETNTQDSDYDRPFVVPESSLTRLHAIKTNGEQVAIENVKDLEDINLSEFKELTIKTQIHGKDINSNTLQKIFNEAVQLETLTIENFAIDRFPEIKTPNHRLKKLILNDNNLKALHTSISNLVALEDFVSSNPLQELPETFSQLKNLKRLSLDEIAFTTFPKEIFNLNKLTVLYISGNYKENSKINEIPDWFQQLPNLKEISVTASSLNTLPKSIATLKKLETANFSYNKFTDFPEVLATLPNLVYVPFANNPLDWEKFLVSIKKIKWRGLLFLNGTGFSKKQYEEVQKILSKTDVYYDGMND